MLNVKNHHLYSSKFSLSVIDLNQTNLATDEDKAYGIDYWARLFKVKTWEELKMLAKYNEYLEAATNSLYESNEERMVRSFLPRKKPHKLISRLQAVSILVT